MTIWCTDIDNPPDVTKLPSGLKYLNLHANRLTGVVDLCHLPGNSRGFEISLHNNDFTAYLSKQKYAPTAWIERDVPRMSKREYEKSLKT